MENVGSGAVISYLLSTQAAMSEESLRQSSSHPDLSRQRIKPLFKNLQIYVSREIREKTTDELLQGEQHTLGFNSQEDVTIAQRLVFVLVT